MNSTPLKKDNQAKTSSSQNTSDKSDDSTWKKMIHGIIRPPRAKYEENQLGGKYFSYHGQTYTREEHEVKLDDKKIELTLYLAENRNNYLILYMHGNSSCKVQAINLIRYLPQRVSLGSFDFMGCGRNQELTTISLGYRQAKQAETVCEFLRSRGFKVILWGRSMGAATALLYGNSQFIVADSSYKSFKSLCKQVAKQNSPSVVPNILITAVFPLVFGKLRKDVDKEAQYDVQQLDVREAVKKLNPKTAVVFMTGEQDKLIVPRNSEKLWKCCPCERKYLKMFKGDHNSRRPDEVMLEIMNLIQDYIKESEKKELKFTSQKIQAQMNKTSLKK